MTITREPGATVVGIEKETGWLIFEDADGVYTTGDTLASFGYGNLTDAEQDLVVRLEDQESREFQCRREAALYREARVVYDTDRDSMEP